MGKNMKGKRQADKIHLTRRLDERYDIKLNKELHKAFIKKIQAAKGLFVRRLSNHVTIWTIQHEDKEVILVYNKERKSIITALPSDSYDLDIIRTQNQNNQSD